MPRSPRTPRRPLLLLLLVLGSGTTLGAHDFWLVPTAFQPNAGALVSVRLMVGQDLLGDPVPRDADAIERFVVARGATEKAIAGLDGSDPAGVLRVDAAGLMIVGYHSRPHAIELPPEKFEQYLGDEGLDAIKGLLAGSRRRGSVVHELFSRCAKALLTSGTPSAADRDRALGLRLELIAERNPYTTMPGEAFPVILRYEGRPQPAALVIALNQADPSKKLLARSDQQGRVTFRFPRGGVWLIKAVHMIPAAATAHVDWESFWASLTFELPLAEPPAPR